MNAFAVASRFFLNSLERFLFAASQKSEGKEADMIIVCTNFHDGIGIKFFGNPIAPFPIRPYIVGMGKIAFVYETGIDCNRDRHCDLCGWLLDPKENHRARRIRRKGAWEERPEWAEEDHHLETMPEEEFAAYCLVDSPYSKLDWNKEKHKAILAYSENSRGGVSCVAINGYLRSGKIQEGLAESDIASAAASMDSSISQFVLGRAVTLYRGMSFDPGARLLKEFDRDLEAILETDKPASFVDRGFMSLTRGLETMGIYASQGRPSVCHVYMSVTIEKGTAAMPLSFARGTAAKQNDKEVLLHSGQQCYVIGIYREPRGGNLYDYYVNLLATNRRIETCL